MRQYISNKRKLVKLIKFVENYFRNQSLICGKISFIGKILFQIIEWLIPIIIDGHQKIIKRFKTKHFNH